MVVTSNSQSSNRDRQHASEMTQLLRTSSEGRWRNVREQLTKIGVDLDDAAVANLGPDDLKMEAGSIITRNGRCFLFTFDWSTTEDGEAEGSYADAWLWAWREIDRAELRGTEARSADAADAILATQDLEAGRTPKGQVGRSETPEP
jgi:hypothetical protein